MSEEKKEVKVGTKIENPDLTKQVASIAFTLRKVKDWLEEKMGADIDGDGRVGGGPYKKISVLLCIVGLSAFSVFGDSKTNIANWGGTEAAPFAYIDKSGNMGVQNLTVNNFTVNTNMTISGAANVTGNATVSGAITGNTLKVTGNAVIGNGLTVNTNATVGGTLGVTGVATFTATPVCKDGLTVGTNATVGGTLGVTGVATFTATPVCKDGLTVGTNVTISSLTAGSPVFASGTKVLTTSGLISNVNIASGLDSAKLLAGTTVSAINGSALTNVPVTVTKQTGAVTASGANNLVTPTATPTLQVGSFGISLTLQTYQLTNDTALVITNVILNLANAMTNLTVAVTPDLASNSVVAVSVTGGGAVVTNATASNP